MIKRLSRIFVILTLILTLSFSIVACGGEEDTSTGEQALPEFVPVSFQGVHDFTAPDSVDTWLVKNGVSDFATIVPTVLSTDMKVAKKEFDLLFEDATGLALPSIPENSELLNVDGKYISFGDNAWFKKMNKNPGDEGYDPEIHVSDAEIDRVALKTEGVRIITKKNITYFLGLSDLGVVNCVYDFMAIHFNYEYFYRDTIRIDTNVLDEKAKVFNVKDIPDIDRRMRNIPTYDAGKESQPFDQLNGLTQEDMNNRSYRARLTASHGNDLMGVVYTDNWGSNSTIHNVEEYFQGYKDNVTDINNTKYANYEKYFYDEYIPTGDVYTATGEIQYDAYAPGRLGNPSAKAYVADVDGDGVVDVDENGDGIPDSWGEWGNGISDALKNADKNGDGIGDWYQYGDQKEHENASLGHKRGTVGNMWVGVSCCYTAKGNQNAYQALVKRLAECVMQSCRLYPVEKFPNRNTMLFSIEDAGEPCACEACKELYKNNDDSNCAAVNFLLNDVMEQYVLPWMAMPENAAYDRRDLGFTMGYFVYHNLTNAPVWQDENGDSHWDEKYDCLGYEYKKNADGTIDWANTKERYNVSIYYAGGYRVGQSNWYDNVNAKARHNFEEWRLICNDILIWDYPSFQYGYNYFYDTAGLWNNDYYAYLANAGVKFTFNESQDNGDIAPDWQTLNSYIQSELEWDCNQPIGDLTRDFFDAMYLDAADTMLDIYYSMRVYRHWMADEFNIRGGVGGQVMGQPKYWPLPILQKWVEGMYGAIDELEKYKTINPGLYAITVDHIHIELSAPIMNIMSLYRENLTKADYDKYKEFMLYYSRTYPLLNIKTQNDADFHTLASKL